MDTVKVEQLIVCSKERRGNGKGNHSPIRIVIEVCDFAGNVIAESDPCGGITPETILSFLKWHYPEISEEKHIEKIHAYFIEGDE